MPFAIFPVQKSHHHTSSLRNKFQRIVQVMRNAPRKACDDIRTLSVNKLKQVELRLKKIEILKRELQLLINLCTQESDNCGILQSLDDNTAE